MRREKLGMNAGNSKKEFRFDVSGRGFYELTSWTEGDEYKLTGTLRLLKE